MTTEASTDSTTQDGDVITATTTTTTRTQPQQQGNHDNHVNQTQSTNHNELSKHPRAKTFTLEKVKCK